MYVQNMQDGQKKIVKNIVTYAQVCQVIIKKQSLNSDGQQFHQYQQNEWLPLIYSHWKQKRPWNITLEIQVLARDRHKYVAGLDMLMGFWQFDLQW